MGSPVWEREAVYERDYHTLNLVLRLGSTRYSKNIVNSTEIFFLI